MKKLISIMLIFCILMTCYSENYGYFLHGYFYKCEYINNLKITNKELKNKDFIQFKYNYFNSIPCEIAAYKFYKAFKYSKLSLKEFKIKTIKKIS